MFQNCSVSLKHPLKATFFRLFTPRLCSSLKFTPKIIEDIFPKGKKESLLLYDVYCQGNSVSMIASTDRCPSPFPLFLELSLDCLVPSLHLLHLFPDLLPSAFIFSATVPYLQNGADLFSKGVLNLDHIPTNLPLNFPISVKTTESNIPIAVGILLKSGPSIKIASGALLKIVNITNDDLIKNFPLPEVSPADMAIDDVIGESVENMEQELEQVTVQDKVDEDLVITTVNQELQSTVPSESTATEPTVEELTRSALAFALLEAIDFPLLVSTFSSKYYTRLIPQHLRPKKLLPLLNEFTTHNLIKIVDKNKNGTFEIQRIDRKQLQPLSEMFSSSGQMIDSQPSTTSEKKLISIDQLFLPTIPLTDSPGPYTEKDIRRVVATISQNITLLQSLGLDPSLSSDEMMMRIKSHSKKLYRFVYSDGSEDVYKGVLQQIKIEHFKRKNHNVTVVTNLHLFPVNLIDFSNLIKTKFSVNSSVVDEGSPVVNVQGNFVKQITSILQKDYCIPKKWIAS
ncbi:hypothetical protein RCL1_005691 [Eukaryota sp. TZLM3-RCL]